MDVLKSKPVAKSWLKPPLKFQNSARAHRRGGLKISATSLGESGSSQVSDVSVKDELDEMISTSSDSLTSMTLGTLPPMTSGAMPFDITRWDMPSNYIVAKYTPQKAGCEQRSVFLPGGWEGGRGRR